MNSVTLSPEKAMQSIERPDRYRVSLDQYRTFRGQGFLIVKGLVPMEEIEELRQHTSDLMQGRLPEQHTQMGERDIKSDGGVSIQGLEAPPSHLSPEEKAQYFLRIHMLHRKLELHERYLLHPRVLDVLEAIIGPDILALQSMLFLKPPGKPGQGWHQDRFYIPTHPDSLCGAWIAIDHADEYNGGMWMALGSHTEPIYPSGGDHGPKGAFGQGELTGVTRVNGVSNPDDTRNDLARVADKYPQVLVEVEPGDVVFFNGHVLHRSKTNVSTDSNRRSFVGHYCNARSFTQWGKNPDIPGSAAEAVDPLTGMTNGSHILARGDTHLPFAKPRFGTLCAALLPPEERKMQHHHAATMMANMDSDMMQMMPADPEVEHSHADDEQMAMR